MPSSSKLRAALAQIVHTPDQPEVLFEKHLEWSKWAEREEVDLLVFPETSLTGYPDSKKAIETTAISRTDQRLKELAFRCRASCAVVGFVELGDDGRYYNSIAWLQKGDVLAVHRKINLPTYGRLEEGNFFARGTLPTSVDLGNSWRCGGLICADLWDPGLLYLSALERCSVLAVPIASTLEAVGNGFSNEQGWDLVSRYSSLMYGLPLIRCNWTGPFQDMTFWGGSAITGADGTILAEADTSETFLVADLDLQSVQGARQTLPTLQSLSPSLMLQELKRSFE